MCTLPCHPFGVHIRHFGFVGMSDQRSDARIWVLASNSGLIYRSRGRSAHEIVGFGRSGDRFGGLRGRYTYRVGDIILDSIISWAWSGPK